MSGAKNVDWDKLSAMLPYDRTKEAKGKRKQMFKDFDPNGNGYLSLAEVSSSDK